jgi:hypothetical protein
MGLGTDYERACGVRGYLGVLNVGPAEALVLGEEPMQTSVWSPADSTVVLIRWRYARDDKSVGRLLAGLGKEQLGPGRVVVDFREADVRLFDCAVAGKTSGSDAAGHLDISLISSRVSVSTDIWEPDKETCLILHCIRSAL